MSIEHFNMEVFVRDSREVGYEEGEKNGRKAMLAKFLQSGGTPEQAMRMLGVTKEELDSV